MSVCLCYCIIYPECKTHLFCAILYCHLWPDWPSPQHFFPRVINGAIFGCKVIGRKLCVVILSEIII